MKINHSTPIKIEKEENINSQRIECAAIANLPTKHGEFKMYCYVNKSNGEHHVALVMGDLENGQNVLCRVHFECLTGDVFGSMRCDCRYQLEMSMKMIAQKGSGVLLYMRQEGHNNGLIKQLKSYHLQDQGMDSAEANLASGFRSDSREYAVSAEILRNLGIQSVCLLTNNLDKIHQLKEHGITVTQRIVLESPFERCDHFYTSNNQFKTKNVY